jgi:small-conductance mechanosensitive channel
MEILEINKDKRSIVKITDDERRLILDCLEIFKSRIGKEESHEIDKLKYNVIDQNDRISISKSEAYTIREVLHKVGAFSKEINDLINVLQNLINQISDEQSFYPE